MPYAFRGSGESRLTVVVVSQSSDGESKDCGQTHFGMCAPLLLDRKVRERISGEEVTAERGPAAYDPFEQEAMSPSASVTGTPASVQEAMMSI